MTQRGFRWVATARGSSARAGVLETLHGPVLTPVFMPVGTQATVKAQLPQTLLDSGSQVLLANTYHLLLRPGPEVLRRMGGIHRFMSWPRAVLTDSGGYQVFSLPGARTVSEEGATFRSYVDHKHGAPLPRVEHRDPDRHRRRHHDGLRPLRGVDSRPRHRPRRGRLTARWAVRCLSSAGAGRLRGSAGDSPQALFGIVQGALFPDLRRECAARLAEMPFDGYAIGGLAVGESREEREDVCALTAEQMPQDKPRYLMGVGTPLDLLEAVHRGVDMFDCIIPTQVAQRGGAFTSRGYLQMREPSMRWPTLPLDPDCDCPTCPRHSRAYLHHLIKVREPLGWQLLGQHNLHFYHRLMREMRESILADGFADLYRAKREAARRRRPGQPREAVARANPGPRHWRHRRPGEGCLRRAHGARRLRQHSPRRLGRDHARAHPAHGRGPLSVRRAVGSARAVAPSRRRGSGDRGAAGGLGRRARRRGQCDGGDPLLRGRRGGRRQRKGGRGGRAPGAPHPQLRDRPRPAPPGVRNHRHFPLPAPRRAGHPARHR